MKVINKLVRKINKASKILLTTHENPDGDAIGSVLGMKKALESIGKKVTAICPDEIPEPFVFLPQSSKIKRDFLLGDHDLIIILDCGDLKRTGFYSRIKEFAHHKSKIINIDHHPKNDIHRIASINFVDYEASSTSELIYGILQDMKIKIDKDIATCLLCGLYNDTGAFKHSNTTSEVLKIAAKLMALGARLKKITKNTTNGKSVSKLKLWGLALSRIKINNDLGLVTSVITKKDFDDCGATAADLAGAVNMINTVPQTKAAILLSESEEGKIKASIRTESDKVDVSKLAAIFGGGGLKKASGFSIDGHFVSDGNGGWKVV